ncbi:hypothetical protein ACFL47_05595, partial [Candidatus Latescibacterota bacterium]
ELDRQGRHLMFRYSPHKVISFVGGSLRTRGVGLDNRTNNDYMKFIVNYDVFSIGNIYSEYRHERIQDNISDPYMQVSTKLKGDYMLLGSTSSISRFAREYYYDEREYKNSKVDRLFLDSTIRALPSVTLENHLKIEKNDQLNGVMYDKTYQVGETINTIAMVNKAVYTKQIGKWLFSPGLKYRFYKKDRSDVCRSGDYYLTRIPLLMLKYIISPKTNIMFGMQGVPRFEFQYTDHVQSENDFKQKTYCLQLQNHTTYFGYQVWSSVGYKFDEVKYGNHIRAFENFKSTTLFLNIVCGW